MNQKRKNKYDKCSLIPDADVQITAAGWSVRTQNKGKRSSGLVYSVKRNKSVCKITNCDKGAPPCKHLYLCNCPDFSNPCKQVFKIDNFETCTSVIEVVVPSTKSRGEHHRIRIVIIQVILSEC